MSQDGTPKISYPNGRSNRIKSGSFVVVGRIHGGDVSPSFSCSLADVQAPWGKGEVMRPPSVNGSWLVVFRSVPNGNYEVIAKNGDQTRDVQIHVQGVYGMILYPDNNETYCGADMTPYGTYGNQIISATIDDVASDSGIYQSNGFWYATWTALANGGRTVQIREPAPAAAVSVTFNVDSDYCE